MQLNAEDLVNPFQLKQVFFLNHWEILLYKGDCLTLHKEGLLDAPFGAICMRYGIITKYLQNYLLILLHNLCLRDTIVEVF